MSSSPFDKVVSINTKLDEKLDTELNVRTKRRPKKRLISFVKQDIKIEPGRITLTLPIHTVSEGNNFDPWREKKRRHDIQKKTVWAHVYPLKNSVNFPCTIKLTRIAPKFMDYWDNLPMSLKYIVDALCSEITGEHRPGLADNDSRINIVSPYNQEHYSENKQAYGVRIELEF